MVVLGLDISSTSTGYAVIKNGRFYSRVDVDYGWIKPPTSDTIASKLVFFRKELVLLLRRVKPNIVSIEDAFLFRNPKVLKILSEFRGVAREASLSISGIEAQVFPVLELRSVAGTQDKHKAFSYIAERFNVTVWKFSSHNDVADALIAAYFAYMKYRSK